MLSLSTKIIYSCANQCFVIVPAKGFAGLRKCFKAQRKNTTCSSSLRQLLEAVIICNYDFASCFQRRFPALQIYSNVLKSNWSNVNFWLPRHRGWILDEAVVAKQAGGPRKIYVQGPASHSKTNITGKECARKSLSLFISRLLIFAPCRERVQVSGRHLVPLMSHTEWKGVASWDNEAFGLVSEVKNLASSFFFCTVSKINSLPNFCLNSLQLWGNPADAWQHAYQQMMLSVVSIAFSETVTSSLLKTSQNCCQADLSTCEQCAQAVQTSAVTHTHTHTLCSIMTFLPDFEDSQPRPHRCPGSSKSKWEAWSIEMTLRAKQKSTV